MQSRVQWTLAVAALAVSAWAGVHLLADDAPVAVGKPAAATVRASVGTGDRRPVQRFEAVHAVPESDWLSQFRAAGLSRFEFVARAAAAAYAGDGAAQYYIGRTLARCEETNALYQDADDADEAVSHLAYSPALLDLERQEYLGCRRFLSEDPFKSLPPRAGGYRARYWQERAAASRYPVAVVAAALNGADQSTPERIATALATGSPEAMLLFGWTKATAGSASKSGAVMAAAWVLAACDRGADCRATNDVLALPTCSAGIELGCPLNYTAIDELAASLDSHEFAEASLLARDIQASLQHGGAANLGKYLRGLQSR